MTHQIWTILDEQTQEAVMVIHGTRDIAELNLSEGCVLVEGEVQQTAEPEVDVDVLLAERVRGRRDNRLAASDWTQVPDAPVDQAAWQVYRQALRDITEQEGFPLNITWPQPPA